MVGGQHHRDPAAVPIGQPGLIDVDDLGPEPETPRRRPYPGPGLLAERASPPGQEHELPHVRRGGWGTTVGSPMRPVTTIVILALLAIILVTGIVFVIQLLSVA